MFNEAVQVDATVEMVMSTIGSLQPHVKLTQEMLNAVSAGVHVSQYQTPQTYKEAMAGPQAKKWKESFDKEIKSLEDRKVWTIVDRSSLPAGTNIIPCRWVNKIKLDHRRELDKFKSRVCPKGFRQRKGVDYNEVFAPTGTYKSLRAVLSMTAKWDYDLFQMDVPEAFLNAPLKEDVYMELPDGYKQVGKVVKLKMSLYGLKQAPHDWGELVHNFIINELGFIATVSDQSLYYKRSKTGRLISFIVM